MSNIKNFVATLIAELDTPTGEDAFHRLTEVGPFSVSGPHDDRDS